MSPSYYDQVGMSSEREIVTQPRWESAYISTLSPPPALLSHWSAGGYTGLSLVNLDLEWHLIGQFVTTVMYCLHWSPGGDGWVTWVTCDMCHQDELTGHRVSPLPCPSTCLPSHCHFPIEYFSLILSYHVVNPLNSLKAPNNINRSPFPVLGHNTLS